MSFTKEEFIRRRQALLQEIKSGQILLLGNQEVGRNFRDNAYPFRQDSSFLYYIGIKQAHLNALLDTATGTVTLFGDEASIDHIIWMGQQTQLRELAEQVGITNVLPAQELGQHLTDQVHYLPTYRAQQEHFLKSQLGLSELQPSTELIKAVVKQRNHKSASEIAEMDQAVRMTNNMHRAVMMHAQPGMYESELVAIASQAALRQGAHWSYEPILTINGQILHNHYYGNQLAKGDMVLYDGGVELPSGYCGDITRTWPVAAEFNSLQKDMYELILNSYHHAVSLSKPGTRNKDIHLATCEKLVEGLIALGWMKGSASEAVAAGAHTLFFQCGLGHMIGLDVHDMEALGEAFVGYTDTLKKETVFGLKSLRLGRALEPGFCITIEPGIYVIPELIDKFYAENKYKDFINYEVVQKHRNFGGIRIEDNFVITETGARKLGDDLAISAEAVCAVRTSSLLNHKSKEKAQIPIF